MAQKQISFELFEAFADDLLAERSARPLVIIGTSKVDYLLFEILRTFLLPKIAKVKEQDELLDGDAPLSTFSARIRACRRLGLIDNTLYIALERLRSLRNFSAHSISFTCEKSPVREYLHELRQHIGSRRSYTLTKQKYFDTKDFNPIDELQCLLLTLCVLLEAIRIKVRPTRENRTSVAIAAK